MEKRSKVMDFLILMRVNQWVKNIFVFLTIFFDLQISNPLLLYKTCLAFFAVSFCASATYIFNDYCDIAEDRKHPIKSKRPLAAGNVSVAGSFLLAGLLLFSGLIIGWFLGSQVLFWLIIYVLSNLLYTLFLKHIALVDIFVIALNFVIRLTIGEAVANLKNSSWIILATMLFALFIALAKRRDDVLVCLDKNEKYRKTIGSYNLDFLNAAITIMAAVLIVCYVMYTMSSFSINKFHTDKLYLTVVFVVLGIMRYLQIIFVSNKSGAPAEVLLTDRFIQLVIMGWILAFYAIVL
ncbi:MAG TPA: prenyltransferase [Elusimicrobia bacterium]|nr:prenyltransferase [Elusimicrobiota bacterium]HCE97757.1 prenyltransferase [Elusimicrobiota bacterium]